MTWLKGTTTWANLVDDLTKLACGEMADGSAVTVDAADEWVREISGQNLLRSPASEDVSTGTCYQRAGYFNLASMLGFSTTVRSSFQFHKCVLRQTGLWNLPLPGASNNRWIVGVRVTTINSVAGNYSTARLAAIAWDPDTNLQISSEHTNIIPSSSGDITITLNGRSMTCNVSDPSGSLTVGMLWYRCYTSTYLGGIDYPGPMYARRSANATFTITGGTMGVSGTDYDLHVDISTPYNGGLIGNSQQYYYNGYGRSPVPYGGMFSGVGIKTATALTGAQYSVSWNMALMKIRLVAESGASNGLVTLEWGGGGLVDAGTYRRLAGFSRTSFLRPYQTPGSVTSGSTIQYWMAVTKTRIMIILNANPAQSGKLTMNGIFKFTTTDVGGYDKFPIATGHGVADYTTDNSSSFGFAYIQFNIRGQAWRQDDSEGRDWQTRWIRGQEFVAPISDSANFGGSSYIEGGFGAGSSDASVSFAAMPSNAAGSLDSVSMYPARQSKPNGYDGKWWLYPIIFEEFGFSNSTAFLTLSDTPQVRGYVGGVGAIFHWIPDDGWANGDEITDNVTSDKYFLIAADYPGIGGRIRTAVNTFWGGFAIKEN